MKIKKYKNNNKESLKGTIDKVLESISQQILEGAISASDENKQEKKNKKAKRREKIQ